MPHPERDFGWLVEKRWPFNEFPCGPYGGGCHEGSLRVATASGLGHHEGAV